MDEIAILLVGDEKSILDQAKVFLEREDERFEITNAESVPDALDLVDRKRFDAVVSGFQRSEIHGLEFLKTLREEKGIDVPFILFIEKDKEEIIKKALKKGADRYVEKGGDPKRKYGVMAEIIVQEVGKYRAKERLFRNEKRYRHVFDEVDDGILLIDAERGMVEDVNSGVSNLLDIPKDDILGRNIWDLEPFQNFVVDKNRLKEIVKEKSIYKDNILLRTKKKEIPVDLVIKSLEVGDEKFVQFHLIKSNVRRSCKDELEKRKKDIEALYDLSSKLQNCKNEEEIYQIAISAIEKIFEFDIAGIIIEEDGKGVVEACTSEIPEDVGDIVDIDKGVVGLCFKEKKSYLVRDVSKFDKVKPKLSDYRSGITVPIGYKGIFQAVSKEIGDFDEGDLKIAKLFISHLEEALERIEREKVFRKTKERIEKLHDVSVEFERCKNEDEIYSLAVKAAEDILDFNICSFDSVEADTFRIKALSTKVPEEGSMDRPLEEGGLDTRTYREQRPFLINDLHKNDDAKPVKNEYKSAISVPIGHRGVFQAVSTEKDHFNMDDVKMAELLINHVKEALKRVEMSEMEQFLHTLLRHDVSNKIQVINGYLHLIEEDFELPETAEKYLALAKKGAKNSVNLIDKVGMLRKAEEEDIRDIDMGLTIKEAVYELKDISKEKGFRLKVDIPSEMEKVKGGTLLKEVFSNIIENSIKHSEGSIIQVSCEELEDKVICKIEDDGVGIADDKKEKIFEKGYTGDTGQGSGLGLYLVKVLLKRYGGSISLKDSSLGGAKFDIKLKKI